MKFGIFSELQASAPEGGRGRGTRCSAVYAARADVAPGCCSCGRRQRRAAFSAGRPPPDQNLAALFATRAPLSALTPREQDVCRRILLGFSSEAISQVLGISLHSTLTYRKSAYERLGISSQSELFSIVLGLLAGPSGLNQRRWRRRGALRKVRLRCRG